MDEITIKCTIDSIASLDAQIALLKKQREKMAEEVKAYMRDSGEKELMSATGHKALFCVYSKNEVEKKTLVDALIAKFGEAFVEPFKKAKIEERLTVK